MLEVVEGDHAGAQLVRVPKLEPERGCDLASSAVQHLCQRDRLLGCRLDPVEAHEVAHLLGEIDDVVDLAEEVGNFMGLYGIEAAATEQAIALAGACTALDARSQPRSGRFGSRRGPRDRPLDLASTRATAWSRDALTSLFDGGIDPMVVIRWKDIYERLEQAIDGTRHHVGNTLESLIVKLTHLTASAAARRQDGNPNRDAAPAMRAHAVCRAAAVHHGLAAEAHPLLRRKDAALHTKHVGSGRPRSRR